jgi:hypothetical protein
MEGEENTAGRAGREGGVDDCVGEDSDGFEARDTTGSLAAAGPVRSQGFGGETIVVNIPIRRAKSRTQVA